MLNTTECKGHPRDMGLAQGAAAKAAIRGEVARLGFETERSRWPSLRGLTSGGLRGRGAGREMFRHFAHQSERLEGVARGAGVPMDSILALHLRIRAGGEEAGLLARRATVRATGVDTDPVGEALSLERSLPRAVGGEAGWIVRESRPEVGFRSIEVGLPWLVPAVAGVNESGLTVVGGPLLWGKPGREGKPTSLLLVQECLQRFEDLEGAIGWCRKRPVEGEQSLVIADATGTVVTVIVGSGDCRVQPGDGELHLEAGELSGAALSSGSSEPSASPSASPSGSSSSTDRIWLSPSDRRLRLSLGGDELEVSLADSTSD